MNEKAVWADQSTPRFPALDGDHDFDVAIIGAGITGATAAYLLQKAGLRVVVLERHRCGQGETSATTAHLTYVTDARLTDLADRYGREQARNVWNAGRDALDQMDSLVRELQIDCGFTRVPGYLTAALDRTDPDAALLDRECELAAALGFSARRVDRAPVFGRPAIEFANQAIIHPGRYLSGLLWAASNAGCRIFENSAAKHFASEGGRLRIQANGHTITCPYVIIATNMPLTGVSSTITATLLQTKMSGYTSYAIAGAVPHGRVQPVCLWDVGDPYYYLRTLSGPDSDWVIFGGLDRKTGQDNNPRSRFDQLRGKLSTYLPGVNWRHEWCGQIVESQDDLPLIGETHPQQFICTAYSGNGLTFGTCAALMARDGVLRRDNPWFRIFDPKRALQPGRWWRYIKENADYPYFLVKDRIAHDAAFESIAPGQGAIVSMNGTRTAVHRDEFGAATLLSPVCPHLGCIVHWNNAAHTWDCPCHGSRFAPNGDLLSGPAESGLRHIDVSQPRRA
ncbi:MAG: FAD-dependent oxidoreductase [Phycisphaerales bacterium]|nr:FAD-dependent oxidoreductase [Phycisphaerales bacterium]